jgi:hypothetical protein
MSPEKLLSRHFLDNGFCLEFWDLSRPVAGDRWQVVLEARVAVPITAATLPPDLRPRQAQVTAALGREILFSQKEVRNFMAAGEVGDLLKEMEARLLSALSAYLVHPDFAGRLIRKKFTEYQEKQRWYQG